MLYMHRKLEQDIRSWIARDSSHPLLMRGARRTGKTTLVETVGKECAGEYFAKLDFQTDTARTDAIFSGATDDVDRITSNIAEYLRVGLDKEKSILFFDEVQLNEKALNSLRFFSESGWRVIATESLLGASNKRRRLPFPSGVRQIELHPMDFEEWLWAVGERRMPEDIRAHAQSLEPYILHSEALEHYHRYLVVGGMPKAVCTWVQTHDYALVREVLDEIDLTYTADMTDPENGISGCCGEAHLG